MSGLPYKPQLQWYRLHQNHGIPNTLSVPGIMSDLLIVELIEQDAPTRAAKVCQIMRMVAHIEFIQGYIKDLEWNGAKRVSKDLDAYKIILREGANYLKVRNPGDFPFECAAYDTKKFLLPAILGVAYTTPPGRCHTIPVDLLSREFWALFFKDTLGTPNFVLTRLLYEQAPVREAICMIYKNVGVSTHRKQKVGHKRGNQAHYYQGGNRVGAKKIGTGQLRNRRTPSPRKLGRLFRVGTSQVHDTGSRILQGAPGKSHVGEKKTPKTLGLVNKLTKAIVFNACWPYGYLMKGQFFSGALACCSGIFFVYFFVLNDALCLQYRSCKREPDHLGVNGKGGSRMLRPSARANQSTNSRLKDSGNNISSGPRGRSGGNNKNEKGKKFDRNAMEKWADNLKRSIPGTTLGRFKGRMRAPQDSRWRYYNRIGYTLTYGEAVGRLKGHKIRWRPIKQAPVHKRIFFQNRMVKNKEKDKAKRLFEDSPRDKAAPKHARKSPPEAPFLERSEEAASTQELMDDLMFCEELPATPAKPEKKDALEGMVMGTPMQMTPQKVEPEKEKGALPLPLIKSQEEDFLPVSQLGEPERGKLDWKIPSVFRMEWIEARVEQLMLAMDIVGGMFSPIFIIKEASPIKQIQEAEKPIADKIEPLSFFKSRIKRKPVQAGNGQVAVGSQPIVFAREPVRDAIVKVIEALNQGQRDPRIASYLQMLELLHKAKSQSSSFASRTAGGPDYNKLWGYAVRKLVWFTSKEWNMPTANPILPLIREVDPETGSMKIHGTLLNCYEEMLFKALANCGDEAGKQRALEYWAYIASTFDAITGNAPYQKNVYTACLTCGLILSKSSRITIKNYSNISARGGIVGGNMEHNKRRMARRGSGTFFLGRPGTHMYMFRLVCSARKVQRGRRKANSKNFAVSEKMSNLLIVELIECKETSREVKLKQIRRLVSNIEMVQGYLGELRKNISKNQGEAELKELAWDGTKRVAKDLSAYKVILSEGAKYLEGKNPLAFPFDHTYGGTNSALLPAVIGVADSKPPGTIATILVDLLSQEFWAAFFKEAQGTYNLYTEKTVERRDPYGLGIREKSSKIGSSFIRRTPVRPTRGTPPLSVKESYRNKMEKKGNQAVYKLYGIFRYDPAARLYDSGGGILQNIPGRPSLEKGKRRTRAFKAESVGSIATNGTAVTNMAEPAEGNKSPKNLHAIMSYIFFRINIMSELSARISDVISEAYSKGHIPGEVRSMVIKWCSEYLFTDSTEMQQELAEQLRVRLGARTIKFESAGLVQAVKVLEIVPVARRQDMCGCWDTKLQECGLCEYSLKDRSFVAGLHHVAANVGGGVLTGCGVTVQYVKATSEAVKAAVAGLLFKLIKILSGMAGVNIRQRMIFSPLELKHHKTMIVESGIADRDLLVPLNMVLLTWRPFLGGTCGLPDSALPSRVFVTMPSSQTGSYFAACTDAANFKDKEVIKNVVLPLEDFPKRAFSEKRLRAVADEPLIASLKDYQESVEEILEKTRGQMAPSRRFLVKIGVLQGSLVNNERSAPGYHRVAWERFTFWEENISINIGKGKRRPERAGLAERKAIDVTIQDISNGRVGFGLTWQLVRRRARQAGWRATRTNCNLTVGRVGQWTGPRRPSLKWPTKRAGLRSWTKLVSVKNNITLLYAWAYLSMTGRNLTMYKCVQYIVRKGAEAGQAGLHLKLYVVNLFVSLNKRGPMAPAYVRTISRLWGKERTPGVHVLMALAGTLWNQCLLRYVREGGIFWGRDAQVKIELFLCWLEAAAERKEPSGTDDMLKQKNCWNRGGAPTRECSGIRISNRGLDLIRSMKIIVPTKCLFFSEDMTLYNLHLFGGMESQWDRVFGKDGGLYYKIQEGRLSAFLDQFTPEKAEDGLLESAASSLMKPGLGGVGADMKAVRLDKIPDACFAGYGFRGIWESNNPRNLRNFRAGVRIFVREKIGNSKANIMKIEESAVNGDRVLEIMMSLPRSLEECVVIGNAKLAITQSSKVQGAPRWMSKFVKLFNPACVEVPGIYVSIICPKAKDCGAFQDLVFRSFPELAGAQLEEWRIGEKVVRVVDSEGNTTDRPMKAFYTRIGMALAIHYAGTGTVALDRRAPDAMWLTFEDYVQSRYVPCRLCQSHDGHYATEKLEKPKGVTELLLVCPNKGTCPECGQGQAAFLYGGHMEDCVKGKQRCEGCAQGGLPADHKPMDTLECQTYRNREELDHNARRIRQASINKSFEALMAKAIATRGQDFQPYLSSRREAATSKASLNQFYNKHEELGDFQDQLRAMAPGNFYITLGSGIVERRTFIKPDWKTGPQKEDNPAFWGGERPRRMVHGRKNGGAEGPN